MHFGNVELDAAFIDAEDIVAKLHFLDQMERRWPYNPAKGVSLSERVACSLTQLPPELQQFALAVFTNVIYLPDTLLRESWSYLASKIARDLGITVCNLFEQSHLLEVDPSGLIPTFLHENKVHGRLDTDHFSRLQSIDELANNLRLIGLSDKQEEGSVHGIRLAFSRPFWLLLSDNVLSGTSVASDLSRCDRLINAYSKLGTPKIIPVTQVLTSSAESSVLSSWTTTFALRFDKQFQVLPGNEDCSLFSRRDTLDGAIRLCDWFASQDWFSKDDRLTATLQKSGDNMAYGYKRGGWTIVTPNCPTNSLPILWYEREGVYKAPFPRIMSRTSQMKGHGEELTEDAISLAPRVLKKLGVVD
ncbi:MAG: hypothetical protein WCX06_00485 [Candidatus Paceibacterota bacterium]|jgi:hypothetical protein